MKIKLEGIKITDSQSKKTEKQRWFGPRDVIRIMAEKIINERDIQSKRSLWLFEDHSNHRRKT